MNIRLKEVMKEKGVSGRELASMLNTTPQYVSNIVSGRQNLSLDAIEKVANILGVQPWELFVSKDEVMGDSDFVAMVRKNGKYYHAQSIGELKDLIISWDMGND